MLRITTLLLSICTLLPAASGYQYFVTGNSADVVRTTAPGFVLAGGGTDVDDAFRWMINKSGGGDFVIIRASGDGAYNPYIYALGTVDSVETLVIRNKTATTDSFVIDKIRNAEALFIAGGDQSDYLRLWKGTPVEDAVQYLIGKGVPVGGTSAGLAVLGEFIYTGEKGSATSSDALANPYNRLVTLDRDFLSIPMLTGAITDSHFIERDRMGRLVTFLARIIQDGWKPSPVRGIGVESESALTVEPDGTANLLGVGAAYFLLTPSAPQVCTNRAPLTFQNLSVYRITPGGGTFNIANWTGSGGLAYTISATNGTLTSSKGTIY